MAARCASHGSYPRFLRAMSGLMQLNPRGDWQDQAERLLDLLMDGLRAGARTTG